MSDTQVSFEDLLPENKQADNKTEKTSKKKKNSSGSSSKTAKSSAKKEVTKKTASKKSASGTKTASASKRKSVKAKNPKVTMTQEDMDKLCEVYDWYLQVKDMDLVRSGLDITTNSIEIEDDIVKNKKRISAVIDEEIWEDFNRLCGNTEYNKGEVLTQAIKEFLMKHRDII